MDIHIILCIRDVCYASVCMRVFVFTCWCLYPCMSNTIIITYTDECMW